ncbi:MAG: hypothetical protein ABIH89_03845 [Elusimicrobiota bacterium]
MKAKFVLFILILFMPCLVFAGVPNEINYQGRLRESDVGVTGNRTFKFNIYDADSGGNLLWTSNDHVIFVSSGVFNHVLEPDVDWRKQDLWIETLVGGSILIPRQKVTSNAYALHAGTSEGITINAGTIGLTIGSEISSLSIENTQLKCLTASTTYYMVPKGAIIMWSGNPGDLPDGWALCDGASGTPDLRGRFIVGYNSSDGDYSSVGNAGGEKAHTLITAEMPGHTHPFTSGTESNTHSHSGTTSSNGSHTHSYTTKAAYYSAGGTTGSTYWGNESSADTSSAGSHSHTFATGTESTSHTHSGTTNSTGGGTSHENRPPYYTLAFIMRL